MNPGALNTFGPTHFGHLNAFPIIVPAGGWAGPVFQGLGTSSSTVGGAGNTVPTWPTHAANDIGLLFVETLGSDAAPSAPSGWVEVTNSPQVNAGAGVRLQIFWKRATSGSETNPSIPDPGGHCYAVIGTFRGCTTSGDPWDVTAGDSANGTTAMSIPGATTTVANCLVVAAMAWANDNAGPFVGTITNASLANLTERQDEGTTDGDGGGVFFCTGEKAAAGAYSATTATITSTPQARISIALKP